MSYRNRNKILEDKNIKRDFVIDTKASFDPVNRGRPTKFNRKNWMGSILAAHLAEGGGTGIAIDYLDLGSQDGTASLDISLDGDKKYVRKITLANSTALVFSVSSSNLSNNTPIELYLIFVQDSTGNRKISTSLSATIFPQGDKLNGLLDKTADSSTIFRLITVNGGGTWYIEKVGIDGTSNTNQKKAVRAATTANITLSGTQTIDGVALVADDRVLVKDQTDGTTNGIYIVKSGAAWTRSTDADSDAEILNMTVLVNSGDTYDNLSFLCTNDSVTLGTTSLEFAEFGNNYTDVDVLAYLNTLLADGWTNITNFTAATQQWWIDSTDAAIAFVKGLATAGIAALNAFIAWLGSGTNIIDKIWSDLKSSYTWLKDTLQLVVDDIWGSLKGSYTWLKDTLQLVVDDIWGSLKGSYTWLKDTLQLVVDDIWGSLKGSYTWLKDTLQLVVDDIWGSLKSSYSWLEDSLSAVASNIWGSLKSSYSWLENTLSSVASNIWGSLKNSYSWLENSVSAVAANIWTSLKSSYSWLSDTITGVVSSVTSALGAAWTWLNALDGTERTAITTAATWVASASTKIGNYLSGLSAAAWNNITNFGSAISAGITSALGAAWTWLNALDGTERTAITTAATWVASASTKIGNYLSGLSAAAWNNITNFGSAISAGITSALGAAWTWLNALDGTERTAITTAATWVASASTKIGNYLSGLSAAAWNNITNFGSAISAGITSALGAAWTWLNALDGTERTAITTAATWVASASTKIGNYLSGLSAAAWNNITNFGSAISAGITSALGAAWTWLNALDGTERTAITTAATWVASASTKIGNYLSGLSAAAWNNITNFGSAISAGITSALGAAWTWLNALDGTERTAITTAATWVASASTKIGNYLSGLSAAAWNNITNFGSAISAGITSALGAAWTWLNALDGTERTAITTAATWVASASTKIGNYLSGLSAAAWNNITNFGSAISAGITSALGAAWTWLNALDGTERTAITTAATWVASASTKIGNYLSGLSAAAWNNITNFGSAISAGITSALGAAWTWLNALDGTERTAITTAATWVASASTKIGNYLSGLSAAAWNNITNFGSAISAGITSALGAAWTWLNALDGTERTAITTAATWVASASTKIGNYLSGLSAAAWNNITNFGSAISAGITSALGAAWTWLNALDGTERTAITTAATWVADASAKIYNILSSGATSFLSAAQTILFGGATPSTFAESEADGQITSSLNTGGSIITKINASLLAAFTTFATDLGATASTTFDTLLGNISSFLSGGSSGANRNLSNLGDGVAINKSLNFKLDTDTGGGTGSNSFGFDDDNNMYLKMKGPADIFRIQASSTTQIEIANRGIKLVDGVGDPTANGEIKRVGNTIKIKVNNSVKDLADIGSGSGGGGGGGGGSETVTANQFIIKNSSDYASASASVLDTDYGSERGCIGIRCNTTVSSSSDRTRIYLYIKSSSFWFGFTMTARLSATNTLVGTAYGTSTTKRRIKYTTSGIDAATESLVGTVEGRLYTHQESSDADDGSFGIYSGGLRSIDYGNANLDRSSVGSSSTTVTLLDTVPTTQLIQHSLNNSALDSAYGSAEGTMGFNRNTNDLFIKVNGYWWYRELYVQT